MKKRLADVARQSLELCSARKAIHRSCEFEARELTADAENINIFSVIQSVFQPSPLHVFGQYSSEV